MYKQVYIVDDDEISVFLTEVTLAEEKFAMAYQTFLNPQQALQNLRDSLKGNSVEQVPDIIFLDINMPGMSGWEFMEALAPYQAHLQDKSSIYLLTSSIYPEEMDRAGKHPLLKGFLQKPLSESTIQQLKEQAYQTDDCSLA